MKRIFVFLLFPLIFILFSPSPIQASCRIESSCSDGGIPVSFDLPEDKAFPNPQCTNPQATAGSYNLCCYDDTSEEVGANGYHFSARENASSYDAQRSPVCGSANETIPGCASCFGGSQLNCYGGEFAMGESDNVFQGATNGLINADPDGNGKFTYNGKEYNTQNVYYCKENTFACATSGCTPLFDYPQPVNEEEQLCDLGVTTTSPADYLYGVDPSLQITWTEPGKTVRASEGEEIIVKSQFPQDKAKLLYSRIPFLQEIWSLLYNSKTAVYRSLLPKNPGSESYWDPGAINSDFPAETNTPYTFPNTGSYDALAGNGKPGTQANFYFKYLGAVAHAHHTLTNSTLPYPLAGTVPLTNNLGNMIPLTPEDPENPSTSGTLSCQIPLTSCSPVNWDLPIFNVYEEAYNQDNNSSWTQVKYSWAQNLIDNSGVCPQFLATLWLEESGGGAVGRASMGCLYQFGSGTPTQIDKHPTDLSDNELQQYQESLLREQISCVKSYIDAIGNDFNTLMCQYSGEKDTNPNAPFRQCTQFRNNPNFPKNICKIWNEIKPD